MAEMKNILDGIRVLDFSQALAGPTTTRLMAEMGAEVIKVELAPNGEASRALPYQRNGRSGYYIQQNRGKKSIGIDRKDPRSVELLYKVLEKCDVLVENFAPGAVARLGFGWEKVHQINPRLIMGSISAFGQTGPLSSLPGYDYIGAAYAGVLSMIGEADGPPYFYMLGIGDVMTGTHLLAAINGALYYREKTGRGQYVEASLLDSYFHCHEVNVQAHTASGGEIKPFRCGQHHYAVSPLGIYKCREGYVIIAVLPNQWQNFCNAIGRPEIATDPRFCDGPSRIANRDQLNVMVEAALEKFPSAIEAAENWGFEHHVPIAPILTIEQACKHPHLVERETIRTVKDPVFGDYQVPGMPLRLSEGPRHPDLRAAYLGEHNVEVFTKYAGVSEGEVRKLEQEGALIAKPDL
ncbi:MAG: CoA transferase [Gammaproteobacteria bacterium]|nr:CoA transferase [Gammaproteobacteria bacterium]